MHYFGLKKKRDERVKGVSYEAFVQMKAEGHFDGESVLEDQKLQGLFLQWARKSSVWAIKYGRLTRSSVLSLRQNKRANNTTMARPESNREHQQEQANNFLQQQWTLLNNGRTY